MASPITVSTDDRVVIAGATGTGKTTLVATLLLPAVPASHTVIILDPKRTKRWKGIPDTPFSLMGRPQIEAGTTTAFRWGDLSTHDDGRAERPLARDGRFNRLLRAVWKLGNVLIISDETNSLFMGPYTMTSLCSRLIREGRERNIGFWWLMQRASAIPQIILTEAESWAIFTMRRKLDRMTAAGFVGDRVTIPLPQEQERSHYFYWSRPGMAQPTIMRLTLTEDS